MFKKLLACAILFFSFTVFSQEYSVLRSQAQDAGREKKYAAAVELFRQAFQIEAKNRSDLYDAACYASLANEKDLAFAWLGKMIQLGFANIAALEEDPDFLPLHADPRWAIQLKDLTQRIAVIEKDYDKPLQKQLLEIYKIDQEGRLKSSKLEEKFGHNSKEVQSLWDSIGKSDYENRTKMEAILQKHGWVGPDKVGARASEAIFLVVQHSDLKFQQQYLPMMREAVKNGRARGSSLALLEDRVALGEGRKQIYGSQLIGDVNGKITLSPIEDPDNVDARRASVGLPPIAEYLKNWNLIWDVEEHKKKTAKE